MKNRTLQSTLPEYLNGLDQIADETNTQITELKATIEEMKPTLFDLPTEIAAQIVVGLTNERYRILLDLQSALFHNIVLSPLRALLVSLEDD